MALKDLPAACDTFMELKGNLEEGIKFYDDLTQKLIAFRKVVKDFCITRKTKKESSKYLSTAAAASVVSGDPVRAQIQPRPPQVTVASTSDDFVEPRTAQEFHTPRLFNEEIRLSRLLGDATLLSWAVEASAIVPSAPADDGAHGGDIVTIGDDLPGEEEQMAWAVEASQVKDQHSAAANLLSVLTFEEQIELAKRQSESSRTPNSISPGNPIKPLLTFEQQIEAATGRSESGPEPGDKRLIVFDGPNVAWARGFSYNFSAKRLLSAFKVFKENGHDVAVFLPKKYFTNAKPEDQVILTRLEEEDVLFYVQDLSYDDLMIIKYADQEKGIIISNDKYREILDTHPEWEDQILRRTLQFTWAKDTFMIASDPFGRSGPSLDQILHH